MDLSHRNTKTKLESLGDVELKYVSFGDANKHAKLLQERLSDRDFVAKILFQQLVKPKVALDEFQKISDVELEKLAKTFSKNEDYSFKDFKDTGNYFKDFKQALATNHAKRTEELRKAIESSVKSAQEILTTFSNDYASVIQQAIDGPSFIRESLQGIAEISNQVAYTQRSFFESIKPAIEQYESAAKIVAESLRPQIDYWQKWAEQNKKIFDGFSDFWKEFQEEYNIAELKAVKVLQRYKWFITPSFPVPFVYEVVKLDKNRGRHDKAVNDLFLKFFEQKNWRNLKTMVNDWKKNPLLKKRYKILADCLAVVRLSSKKGINNANVVLPTLITQIDGVLTDYLDSKGIRWDCDYDDWIDRKTGKVKKIGRKTQFKNAKPKGLLSTELDDLANDIFLNILFQSSQKGKPLATPFNFNRHKIIHGESIKFGRKDYMVRAFMVLDLLAHF